MDVCPPLGGGVAGHETRLGQTAGIQADDPGIDPLLFSLTPAGIADGRQILDKLVHLCEEGGEEAAAG